MERKTKGQSVMAVGQSQELLAGDSLRLSLDRRRRGSPHKGIVKAVRNTIGGGRGTHSEISTPRSRDSQSEGSSVHTVRSFTSDTDAIKLSTLKEEDPGENAARAKYYAQMGLTLDGGLPGALHVVAADERLAVREKMVSHCGSALRRG